tara:strand:+ start:972 stop:1253 length:282 start_codon:yes stop_codon:yes gene_type:complete
MDKLRSVIYEIIDCTNTNKFQAFKETHGDLFLKFPVLLKMACESELDKEAFLQKFEYYVSMRSKVEKQELTLDEADIKVGSRLGKEYIPAHFK